MKYQFNGHQYFVFHEIESYPTRLKDLVERNMDLFKNFSAEVDDEIRSGRIMQSLVERNKGVEQWSTFLFEFSSEMRNLWMQGYHLSRVLDPEEFSCSGINILETEMYLERMKINAFRLGYSEEDQHVLLSKLTDYLYGQATEQKLHHMLSLFSPASSYILKELDGGYISLYASTVGGEVASKCLADYSRNKFANFRKLGHPVLLEFVFPLSSLVKDQHEYCSQFVCSELIAFIVQQLRGQPFHNSVFLAQVDERIPTENIIQISEVT